jgi:predicted nucleic acid-binding protein
MSGAIVSNTGPLVALAVIDRLNLLNCLFDEVIVPQAVHFELLEGGTKQAGVTAYQQAHWIKNQKLTKPHDPLLGSVLDAGEASVIQLARERSIHCVLIDERKGRQIAREIYGLKVIGSARVLVEAKRQGYLDNVEKAITAMRQHGYWLHENIVTAILKKAGEL